MSAETVPCARCRKPVGMPKLIAEIAGILNRELKRRGEHEQLITRKKAKLCAACYAEHQDELIAHRAPDVDEDRRRAARARQYAAPSKASPQTQGRDIAAAVYGGKQ